MIKNVKNTLPWAYVVSDLNREELLECFVKTNSKKQIKNKLQKKN